MYLINVDAFVEGVLSKKWTKMSNSCSVIKTNEIIWCILKF